MSTKKDSPPPTKTDGEWELIEEETQKNLPTKTSTGSHLSDSAASLGNKLSKEQDDRQEERFYWIFAVIILIDVIVFPTQSAVSATFISLLELVLLIGLAKFLGVDSVVKLLENMFNKFNNK